MVDVGVVVGRFQVSTLHEGHRYLLNRVFEDHTRVVILVGISPILGTKHDPLDFKTRYRMLQAEYPDAVILPLKDHLSNDVWSKTLDTAVRTAYSGVSSATLYGGRDHHLGSYVGKFGVEEHDGKIAYQNGTLQRKDLGKVVRNSADFRAGVIYSTQNSFPYTQMCVDIALIDQGKDGGEDKILLGRKESEDKWRLPGGKVDQEDASLEHAARRELFEETGMVDEHNTIQYIASMPIGDWRFKNAGELGLMSALFKVDFAWGAPRAGDDLVEVEWFDLKDARNVVVNGHKALITALL